MDSPGIRWCGDRPRTLPERPSPGHTAGAVENAARTLEACRDLPTTRPPTVRIEKLIVGPFENNVFVVRCKGTGEAVIIDAANEHELLLEVSRATGVRRVLTTHGHWDHIQAVTAMRDAGIDVGIAAEDADDAARLRLRDPRRRRDHRRRPRASAPSTTRATRPGSTSFLLEGHPIVFSGDTLFPGGAGNTTLPGRRLRADHRVDRPPPLHAPGRHCSCCPATASTPPSARSVRTSRSGSTVAGSTLTRTSRACCGRTTTAGAAAARSTSGATSATLLTPGRGRPERAVPARDRASRLRRRPATPVRTSRSRW